MPQLRIAVVDDHDLVQKGISALLTENGAGSVEAYGNASALVSAIDAGASFDIYVIDLELPGIDGFELIGMIRARNPHARIIICTVHDEIWTLRKLLACDVDAIVYKSGHADELLKAIDEVASGGKYYCQAVDKALQMATDSAQHPSARELEALGYIARGLTSREIAAAMYVSENTIEAHRKALFAKLGAANAADLIIKAVERGYINKSGERL